MRKGFPANDETIYNPAKQIALQVKEYMVDKNAYESYKVLFIKQTTKGIAVNSESHGEVFKNEELKSVQQSAKAMETKR